MHIAAKLDEFNARLDEIGKPVWIGLMVLAFFVFWPLGLAILAYLIWSGRMGCRHRGGPGRWWQGRDDMRGASGASWGGRYQYGRSSGNWAFDEYRAETLKRLEEEQREFSDYLERLRHAKDKAEFDQFMAERRRPTPPAAPEAPQPGV